MTYDILAAHCDNLAADDILDEFRAVWEDTPHFEKLLDALDRAFEAGWEAGQ